MNLRTILGLLLAVLMLAAMMPLGSVIAQDTRDGSQSQRETFLDGLFGPTKVEAVTVTYHYPNTATEAGKIETRKIAAGGNATALEVNPVLYNALNFRGWYTVATPNLVTDKPFDFDNTAVTKDLDLFAVVDSNCLISYADGDGTIVQTDKLKPGQQINGLKTETIQWILEKKPGYHISGWTLRGDESGKVYLLDGTESYTAEADMIFEPVLSNLYTVVFDSAGGSYVEVQAIKYGEMAEQPIEPMRAGYFFDGWYLPGETNAFDFNTPITADIVLTAKWAPTNVNYTVAIWLEKANLSTDVTYEPTPGNLSEYSIVESLVLQDVAGAQTPELNDLMGIVNPLFNGERDNTVLKYGTPQWVETKTIAGNGNTVINLFAKRKLYTYNFNLGKDATRSMTIGGKTYVGGINAEQYQIQVKYEQDITGTFPVQGVSFAEFSNGFHSWVRPSLLLWQDSAGIASIRKFVDTGMLSDNGQTLDYTFTGTWSASGTQYRYRYWAEQLPEQENDDSLARITRGGVVYVLY